MLVVATRNQVHCARPAFAARLAADPGAEPNTVIESLITDAGFDGNITQILLACHLDGSLYKRPDGPGASVATGRIEKR